MGQEGFDTKIRSKNSWPDKPLVSVVTVALNCGKQIDQTILSVLSQTYDNIEYIVIDGGSSDATVDVICKYGHAIDYWVSEPDKGIYDAINKGIRSAHGALIGLIHAGDYYEPDSVAYAVESYVNTGADVIYGDLRMIEKEVGGIVTRTLEADHNNLKREMSIFHPATFVSGRCYLKHGLYDCRYKSAADYEFFLRLALSGIAFQRVDKVLANFRTGGASGSNFKLALQENVAIRKRYSGRLDAIRHLILTSIKHYFMTTRKSVVQKCIGKENYSRLKRRRYRERAGTPCNVKRER